MPVQNSSAVPIDADTLLRRKALADALNARGIPTTEKTLATQAVRGGGPPFRKFGRAVIYRWGDALQWAEGRLTPPVTSTAELHAARLAATAASNPNQ
jgi:hypothetical protein